MTASPATTAHVRLVEQRVAFLAETLSAPSRDQDHPVETTGRHQALIRIPSEQWLPAERRLVATCPSSEPAGGEREGLYQIDGEGRATLLVAGPRSAVDWIRAWALWGGSVAVLVDAYRPIRKEAGNAPVVVKDHINLTGENPLVGPNVARWGVRFPDMTEPYDPDLRASLRGIGAEVVVADCPASPDQVDHSHASGLGADALSVNLSRGVIAARHCGLRVAACLFGSAADGAASLTRIARLV